MLQAAVLGGSALWGGFYDFSVWAPVSLVSFAVLTGLLLARAVRCGRLGAVAVLGITGLVLWSAASLLWAPSFDSAWTETNRVAFYAVTLVIALSVIRSEATALAVVRIIAAAGGLVALYVLAQLVTGSGQSMFVEGRLHEPVGYVNGEAAFFLMSFWPLLAIAERDARPAVRGAAVGLAALVLELLLLTQSRAIVPALVVAVTFLLAALPGRLRRACSITLVAVCAAAAAPWLLEVYSGRPASPLAAPHGDAVQSAGVAALVTSAAGGLLWVLATRPGTLTRLRPRKALVARSLALGVGAAVAVTIVALGSPLDRLETEYENFVNLRVERRSDVRFTNAGGYRYDLWRIAADQFLDSPLKGVGAGNYVSTFYLDRRHGQSVRQPHSLEMQMLGELGLAGALALALFLGAVIIASIRRPLGLTAGAIPITLQVAALGTFLVWLAHTSIDWAWNLPGITGTALLAAAVLLRPEGRGEATFALTGRTRASLLVVGVVLVAVAILAASIGRQYAADRYVQRGERSLRSHPVAAFGDAERALRANPESMDARYLKASALARDNRYRLARRTLVDAAAKEPFNYVPWALLGDLATRRGDLPAATSAYRRASALNPFDRALRRLAGGTH